MTLETGNKKPLEDLGHGITYNPNFDMGNLRRFLGLDGHNGIYLNIQERKRQFQMLVRNDGLRDGDLETLRAGTPKKDNPYKKRVCPTHGMWYHDAFGCMHHDHSHPGSRDSSRIDKVCKD